MAEIENEKQHTSKQMKQQHHHHTRIYTYIEMVCKALLDSWLSNTLAHGGDGGGGNGGGDYDDSGNVEREQIVRTGWKML